MVWSEELIWLISCYCSIKSLPFSYKTVRARQAYFQLVATEERERTRGGEGEREGEGERGGGRERGGRERERKELRIPHG